MISEDLIRLLEELSINESEFEETENILKGISIDIKDQKKTYKTLLKCSETSKVSGSLYKLLNDDIQKFLKGLEVLEDYRGIILVNVIKTNAASENLESLILKVLNITLIILKNSDSLGKEIFYLSLYLSTISNFNITNPQHVSLMLQFLNPFHNQESEKMAHEVYSLVLVIIIKNLQLLSKDTTETITSYLEILTDDQTDKVSITNFLNLVKILELIFPILPSIASAIYMSDSCKEIILHKVSKISTISLEYTINQLITTEVLKLVSSSCLNDQCRSFNYSNYLELLKIGITLKGEKILEIRLLSVLDIIKLWNFIQLEKDKENNSKISMTYLSDILIDYLKTYESEEDEKLLEYCVEGLAYLSLNVPVRERLRNDENSMESILIALKKKSVINEKNPLIQSSLVYGLLLILSNLTKLRDIGSDTEKKTSTYLKSFATPNNSNNKDTENQENIHNFNKSLLKNHKIIEVISKLKVYRPPDSTDTNNRTIINQVISIISMISSNQDKSTRQELIKQGALNIVLDYLIKSSVVNKNSGNETRPIDMKEDVIETRLLALRCLARILISVNPSLAFNKYDIKTSLPFLIELLGPDISEYTGSLENTGDDKYLYESVNSLDKYESLLALTNISAAQYSSQATELKRLIISKTFDKYLDNFIIDTGMPQIQRATWELISNLIMEPSLLVKFFNIEKQENLERLQLLIKLLDSRDEAFQIIIGGLLANATSEFEMISQILIQNVNLNNQLLTIFINIFENQLSNDDLLLRTSYILLNLVYSATSMDISYLYKLKEDRKLKVSLGCALRTNRNKEVLRIITEIIKVVKFE